MFCYLLKYEVYYIHQIVVIEGVIGPDLIVLAEVVGPALPNRKIKVKKNFIVRRNLKVVQESEMKTKITLI
jgi:hypothetical protein